MWIFAIFTQIQIVPTGRNSHYIYYSLKNEFYMYQITIDVNMSNDKILF